MVRNGIYYVGRVLKLGLLDQSMLINAILKPTPIEIRGNKWTIIDSQEYAQGGHHFVYGKLSKYSPDGEVTIIDEVNRQQIQQSEPNLLVASSPFVYIPDHSGIAFLNVYSHIEQKTFIDRFSKIIEESHNGFFVDCDIEMISDLKSFAAKLCALDRIYQINSKISPPNPLFGPLWSSLKDYLIERNTDRMTIIENAAKSQSIETDLPNIVQLAADQEHNKEYFTVEEIPIGDAAILMASDGYGSGTVRGMKEGESVTIKTSETAKNFSFTKNPDSYELYEKVLRIFEKIKNDRHMQH
jgi:hypothetical protein